MSNHQRFFSVLMAAALVLPACKSSDPDQKQSQKTTTRTVSIQQKVSEGLDLSQVGELVAEAQTGQELEKILNTSGINNLDLNNDNKIDYLNAEEFREGPNRGFALYTHEEGQRTEVAQVLVSQQSQTAEVVVKGNPNYYGSDARYQSSFPVGQILLAGWLFNMTRPRYYHKPYYYGSYPRYYRTSYPVSRSMYRSRSRNGFRVKNSLRKSNRSRPKTTYKSTTTKPGTTTTTTKSPTRSLGSVKGKSFSTTTKKRPTGSSATKSTGFGTSSTRSTPSRSSSRNSSFGSSSSRSKPTRRKSSFGSSSRRRRRR